MNADSIPSDPLTEKGMQALMVKRIPERFSPRTLASMLVDAGVIAPNMADDAAECIVRYFRYTLEAE